MPAILEKCVKDVKAKGGNADPWAVCTASLQKAGKLKESSKRRKLAEDRAKCYCHCDACVLNTEPTFRPVHKFGEGSSSLHSVEIFASGEHRGKPYSDADLDEMVSNFRKFSVGKNPLLQVPAVLGHEENQELLERSDLPAAAWAKDIWRDRKVCPACHGDGGNCQMCGNKGSVGVLKADFADLPPKVARLLKGKAYRTVSAEVYDEPPEGIPGEGKMLRRVAFLGGEIPQVKSLDEIPEPVEHAEQGAAIAKFAELGTVKKVVPSKKRPGVFYAFSEVMPMNRADQIKWLVENCGFDQGLLDNAPDELIAQMYQHENEELDPSGAPTDVAMTDSSAGGEPIKPDEHASTSVGSNGKTSMASGGKVTPKDKTDGTASIYDDAIPGTRATDTTMPGGKELGPKEATTVKDKVAAMQDDMPGEEMADMPGQPGGVAQGGPGDVNEFEPVPSTAVPMDEEGDEDPAMMSDEQRQDMAAKMAAKYRKYAHFKAHAARRHDDTPDVNAGQAQVVPGAGPAGKTYDEGHTVTTTQPNRPAPPRQMQAQHYAEINTIVAKAVTAAVAQARKQFENEIGSLRKFAERKTRADKLDAVDVRLETLVKDGKVLPAEVPGLRDTAMNLDATALRRFSDGGKKTFDATPFDRFFRMLEDRPKLVEFGERVKTNGQLREFSEGNIEKMAESYYERYEKGFKLAGMDKASFVATFKGATPEQRKEMVAYKGSGNWSGFQEVA